MANQEQLERLLQSIGEQNGCEAWNQWRKEYPDMPIDLSGAALEHEHLSYQELMNADFRDTRSLVAESIVNRLKKVEFTTAYSVATHLRGVDLSHVSLRGADLRGAHLEAANFESVDLEAADFSGAKMSQARLRGNFRSARFTSAFLIQAELTGVDLRHADLSYANFNGAQLRAVHLEEANLSGVLFKRADLNGVNFNDTQLSGADFTGASLSDVRLSGADFTDAILLSTRFRNVDMRGVNGLDTVRHYGPSSFTTDVFTVSRGEIPDIFLRGCGLSDELIAFAHSLAGTVQYPDVFISYSQQDEALATRLFTDLQANNVRCWRYSDDRKGSAQNLFNEVISAIRLEDKLLIIFSEHSVKSDWINNEMSRAIGHEDKGEHIVYPIIVDNALEQSQWVWARDIIRSRKLADFRAWQDPDHYQPMLERLLRGLQQSVYL